MGESTFPRPATHRECEIGLISHLQTLQDVADSNSGMVDRRQFVIGNSKPVVNHLNTQAFPPGAPSRSLIRPPSILGEIPCLIEFSMIGCRIMLGIMQDSVRSSISFFDSQLVLPEATDLDVQVVVDKLHLFPQGNEILVALQQLPQDVGEL